MGEATAIISSDAVATADGGVGATLAEVVEGFAWVGALVWFHAGAFEEGLDVAHHCQGFDERRTCVSE
jgi:hypothetical protein